MLYGWELLTPEQEQTILRGIKDGEAYGGPYHLVLFPTDKCNFDCFFCYTTELRRKARELDWPILRRALEDGVRMGVKGVSFGGGGESMIYRNLPDLFEFLDNHSLTVDSVKTNGSALKPATCDALIRCNLQRILISLNETTRETFADMNQCSPRLFERTMTGIENIVRARNQANAKAEISVQVFLWKDNYQRLLEMIESLLPYEADFIYINSIDGLPPDQQMTPPQKEEFKQLVREAIRRWARLLQFNLMAEGLQDWAAAEHYKTWPKAIELPDLCDTPDRIEYCYIGWYSPVLSADGGVYPCCHFTTDPSRSMGSLHEHSLEEIWHGDRAQRYRREMRHLLFTEADRSLLPRRYCYIHPLCMERTSCAFNYYLASPRVYKEIHDWAEARPRGAYKRAAKVKSAVRGVLRKGKQILTKTKDRAAS